MAYLKTTWYNLSQRGYITLLGVLVVTAVGIVISSSVILLGVDVSKSSSIVADSSQALQATHSCAEHAMQQIHDTVSYSGGEVVVVDGASCQYTVINNGGQNREVQATGTKGNITFRVKVVITKITPNIEIISWQEVSAF